MLTQQAPGLPLPVADAQLLPAVESIAVSDGAAPYREVFAAFAEVGAACAGLDSLEDLLRVIAAKACELVGVSRALMYLREEDEQSFRGRVAHSRRDIDARVRETIVGGPADALTERMVRTRRPVAVRDLDVCGDSWSLCATMRALGVRSMLGVPMAVADGVFGLMFLDQEGERHLFTQQDEMVAASFGNLAMRSVREWQTSSRLREVARRSARETELLRRSLAVGEQLMEMLFDGASLSDVAQTVAELTCKPVSIHDAAARRLAAGTPAGMSDEEARTILDERLCASRVVAKAVAGARLRHAVTVGPAPGEDLDRRLLLAPVGVREDRWGYLVVAEFGSRLTQFDAVVAIRAASVVALELTVTRRARLAEIDARESLASHLLRGVRDPHALAARADYLGFRVRSPHVLCLIGEGADGAPSPEELASALEATPAAGGITTEVAEGTIALLELPRGLSNPAGIAHVKAAAGQALRAIGREHTARAVISGVCREPGDYPGAYGEARQTLRCLESFDAAARVVACDDFGIGRLVLVSADRSDAERFARDTLGDLLAPQNRMADLLLTLRCFFASSRSVRCCADRLAIHQNTVRHRLGRVEEITGLRIGTDADAQLRVQLALLICELGGKFAALPWGGAPNAICRLT